MSFATFAANMGNNMMFLEDRANQQKMQAAQLASMQQTADINALKLKDAKQASADADLARTRKDAYGQLLVDTPDPVEFLKKKADKARELKDAEGFTGAVNELAAVRQKQFADQMNQGLRHFMVSGDPSVLADRFNAQSPGVKIKITPVAPQAPTPLQQPTGSDSPFNVKGAFDSPVAALGKSGQAANPVAANADRRYLLTQIGPDGKESAPIEVGRREIGMMTMSAIDPKFAETIFKEQAKNELEIGKEREKGKIKLYNDNLHQDFVLRRQADLAGVNNKYEMDRIAAQGAEARKTGASNAMAHSNAQIAVKRWEMDNTSSAPDTKELDKRSQTAVTALQKALGEDEFGRLKQLNQPLYLKAIKEIEARVHAGAMPFQAASEVTIGLLQQGAAKTAADSMSQPGGAKGLPLRPTVTLPAF